ncbi:MAG: hypothetical protein ACYC7D_15600 [Nitrososphaerales archaeon]
MTPLINQALFSGTGALEIGEWFLLSVALVVVVTLLYTYVLNKSPPPQGLTVEKLEVKSHAVQTREAGELLESSRQALIQSDYARVVDLAVRSATVSLANVMRSVGGDPSDMNISDLGYLIQTKAKTSPQISQPAYQLNTLRLKAVQGQPVTKEEAEWAASIASWLLQAVETRLIVF